MADHKSTAAQPTPIGDLQASWTRITAAVVLVGFATVGVGAVAMPYLKKGWRWFMGTGTDDGDSGDTKKLLEVLDKHAQQQQELFKQVKDVASAVKTLQACFLSSPSLVVHFSMTRCCVTSCILTIAQAQVFERGTPHTTQLSCQHNLTVTSPIRVVLSVVILTHLMGTHILLSNL